MKFSQRNGFTEVRSVIQKDSMNNDLRVKLWNVLNLLIFENVEFSSPVNNNTRNSSLSKLFVNLWHNFFKEPIDEIPYDLNDAYRKIRDLFFDFKWYEVYDFIEFISENFTIISVRKHFFVERCNSVLEKEGSAYRLVDDRIVEITSEEEISSIETALKNTEKFNSVHIHLSTALTLLSDRKNPDYRNSIKESISAIEALAKIITGKEKATLGESLKILEKKETLHSAFKESFSKLYGYTSDANGVRHSLLEESTLTYNEAKFMLVSCTAFVNFLISKNEV